MLALLEKHSMLYRFLTKSAAGARPELTSSGWSTAERIAWRLWPPHSGATGSLTARGAVVHCLAELRRDCSPTHLYTSSSLTGVTTFQEGMSGFVNGKVTADAASSRFIATAEVKAAANGQPDRAATVQLVRHGHKWLIDVEAGVRVRSRQASG
ncbi:hypothetical protein ACFQV2_20510 [Actinokineospora soli]|uniref:Uncharacterized protein n=1 Tax=Actinokineospora soli TaxID=1048753 RepID=A0ABW2TPT5_9PSEU